MKPRDFYQLLNEKKDRPLFTLSSIELTKSEDCFKSLNREFKSSGQGSGEQEQVGFEIFERAWKPFGPRFDPLMRFCAGLATVFLWTSIVEFDFSRLG